MSTKKPKAILISVGGTPAPIIFSLNHQKPEYICFFVSEETREAIDKDILPNLDFKCRHYDWITTPNAEGLSECYRVLVRKLPEILKKWKVDPKDLVVDYTGGTKTMSVALALATIEKSSLYTYIGGVERTKEGIGVVIDGKESMWYLDNPWDELAVSERREACLLFNKARYSSAVEVFAQVAERVSEKNKSFFKALGDLAEGYDLWDKFRHREAGFKLYRSKGIIQAYATGSEKETLLSLADRLDENLRFLKNLENNEDQKGLLLCYDLLANAKRRAYLEDKFDDAVARLYRAMEALAQFKLKNYGIKTSNVEAEQIPDNLREDYIKRYTDQNDGRIKLPLYPSYLLVNELGDILGKNFLDHYEALRPLLDIRNHSILAHGFNPVSREIFSQMYLAILEFTEIKEYELPEFPELKL